MKKKIMKKLSMLLTITLLILACAGCGGNADKPDDTDTDGQEIQAGEDTEDNTAVSMRLEKSEGSVEVSDENGKEQEPREKLPLFNGYGIKTQTESFSWFNLDDTKLAKMNESSEVSIEKEDKNLKIIIDKGGVYFNVTEPLENDETLEIRTSSMTVGIRGTCGWVDADTNSVYIIHGEVNCTAIETGEELGVGDWMGARLIEDSAFEVIDYFDPTEIPVYVWDELDDDIFAELGLSSNRDDLFAVREPEPTPEPEEKPDFTLDGKETAYRSGYTTITATKGAGVYELRYENGLLYAASLDDEEGKGGWGADSPNGIKDCPYYGMTVEEAAEKLGNQGYSINIH